LPDSICISQSDYTHNSFPISIY